MKRLFQNARIIDGLGDVIEKGWVLVHQGLFQGTGHNDYEGDPAGIEVVDVGGKTILPGLIDCHVHLALDGSPDPIGKLADIPDADAVLAMASFGMNTLRSGFTTVRDLGCKNFIDVSLRNAVDSGAIKGPRIACSGQMICITGGHGRNIGCIADGEDAVRKAVRTQVGAGVDWIKLMATGGVLTRGGVPGMPHYNPAELRAGVEEAHKLHVRTAAHSQSVEGTRNALNAGIDTIEHGVGLDEELVEEMAKRGTFLVPTLSAPVNIMEKGEAAGIPREFVEKSRRVFDEHVAGVQRAMRAGVKIAMGTDAGTPFNIHGENARELVLLREYGFSPYEAIQSATSWAAELLGMEEQIGAVSAGRTADFLLVDGNPLEDLSILMDSSRIHAVYKGGRLVQP